MITLTQSKSGIESSSKLQQGKNLDLSFDQFLEQCPEDGRYELVDGKMVKILATRIHYDVASLIMDSIKDEVRRLNLNYVVNDVAAVLTINKKAKNRADTPMSV